MKRFAVIGNPIAHSLSPLIHQQFAKQTGIALVYEKILSEEAAFAECVQNFFRQGGIGLNVTAPFKRAAFDLASIKTERCLAAEAANTLWEKNGEIYADNTDGIGLIRDLAKHIQLQGCSVLILGAGGGAQGIIPALHAASVAKITVYNRTVSRVEKLQHQFNFIHVAPKEFKKAEAYDIIVNATSASGHPGQEIVADNFLTEACLPFSLCYDLRYTLNGLTPFVLLAQRAGMRACDGLGMLVEQAAEAFCDWHGFLPETQDVLRTLRS